MSLPKNIKIFARMKYKIILLTRCCLENLLWNINYGTWRNLIWVENLGSLLWNASIMQNWKWKKYLQIQHRKNQKENGYFSHTSVISTHAHVHTLKRKEKCKYFFLRMTSILPVDFVLYIAARKIPHLWCSFLLLQSTNERDEAIVR